MEYKPATSEEIDTDLRDIKDWFGDWEQLEARIKELKEQDAERAFDRWSEERYSIDGIAYRNSQPND